MAEADDAVIGSVVASETEDIGFVPNEMQSSQANLPDADSDHSAEHRTLAQGHLSPRHRRFAFLAAQGKSNQDIGTELGYVPSRVSVLMKNSYIADEINKLRERIYEETIGGRMKSFAEPALNVIQMALTDRTNSVKMSEKIQVAQWVIEKIDGKAVQKLEAGENMLAVLMDRLDAAKTSIRPVVNIINNFSAAGAAEHGAVDVTPQHAQITAPKTEEDDLSDWVLEYDQQK